MTIHNLPVSLPEPLYSRLADVAGASGERLEEVVLRCIRAGMPPSLAKIPAEFHDELLAMNRLDDRQLWSVVEGKLPKAERNSAAARRADLPRLRRAYAFAVLKWRGHPVPDPADFLVE
jgi:hypothetical protein